MPSAARTGAGCVVMTGADFATFSVATCVVAEPAALVNTARYRALAETTTSSVVDVAPTTSCHGPACWTCHCTVGVGVPDAVAVNDAVDPRAAVTDAGCAVMAGATCTGAPAPRSATNDATQDIDEFQLIVISLDAHEEMTSR